MARKRATSGKKHQTQNDANPSTKRQRATSSSHESTKIIDLNDNCLEKIFGYLDYQSLLSVGIANEYLRPAANYVYKRKFHDKILNIHGVPIHSNPSIKYHTWVCYEKVSFSDLKTCLQFLRCFGSSLTNLHIYYKISTIEHYEHVHRYMNQYCAETVAELAFIEKPRMPIDHFVKPFVNVHTLAAHYCHYGEQMSSFSKWFPNLRTLKLFNVLMDDRWINPPFQHLEHVRIHLNNNGRNGFTKSEAAQLVCSSHQLRQLKMYMPDRQGMTLNTLLNFIENKPSIEVLALIMNKYRWQVKLNEVQRIITEHPTLIELDVSNFKFIADHVLLLIRQLNFLRYFEFQLDVRSDIEYTQFVSTLYAGWRANLLRGFDANRYVVSLSR